MRRVVGAAGCGQWALWLWQLTRQKRAQSPDYFGGLALAAVHGPTGPRCLQIGLSGMRLLNFKLQAPIKYTTHTQDCSGSFYQM